MKNVLVVLTLFMFLFGGAASAQDSEYPPATQNAQSSADRVLQNALTGQPISGNDVEAFLHWMSVSVAPAGEYERWIPSIEGIDDGDTKSRAIILVALGLAVTGEAARSVQLIERYRDQIKTTYMDNLPDNHSETDREMIAAYYGWLINNTEFSVPGAFVKSYPDIFFNNTPVWAATRDAYFQVTLPEDSEAWLGVYSAWASLLSDAINPAGVRMGSMYNMVHKANLQNIALLEYRPDLYLSYVNAQSNVDWLDYWKFLGPYEARIVAEAEKLERQMESLLVERLAEGHYFETDAAKQLVNAFLNEVRNSFFSIANGPYTESTKKLIESTSASGWVKAVSSISNFHPKAAVFQLQIIGGYLISQGEFRQLENYINWLSEGNFNVFLQKLGERTDGYSDYFIEDQSGEIVAATLLGNLAAQDSEGLKSVMEWVKLDYGQWGTFNKTPVMYAAHHNNFESYKLLRKAHPNLLESTTVGGGTDAPEIYDRNVLTYALENAEFDFVSAVLGDVGDLFVPKTDSAGRNALFYLGLNEKVSEKERKELVGMIQSIGLSLPEASFDCSLAQRRIELLTCGSSEFAALDKELSSAYFAAREKADDPKAVLNDQRRWLSGALDCVVEDGFENCYSSRIWELERATE